MKINFFRKAAGGNRFLQAAFFVFVSPLLWNFFMKGQANENFIPKHQPANLNGNRYRNSVFRCEDVAGIRQAMVQSLSVILKTL